MQKLIDAQTFDKIESSLAALRILYEADAQPVNAWAFSKAASLPCMLMILQPVQVHKCMHMSNVHASALVPPKMHQCLHRGF